MIRVFPKPYPDELLYSLIARYKDMTNLADSVILNQLFGGITKLILWDFPRRLETMVRQVFNEDSYTVEYFINEHTLFQYFSPFMEPNQSERLKIYMLSKTRSHKANGILLSFRKHKPLYLQYCPVCVIEDTRLYGEPFWHRIHQLPAVKVCPKHNTFLEQSTIPTNEFAGIWSLSRIIKENNKTPRPINLQREEHSCLYQIAIDSKWLLFNSPPNSYLEVLNSRLINALTVRGFVHRTRVKPQLTEAFLKYYLPAFLEVSGNPLDSSAEEKRLSSLVHGFRCRNKDPLSYILLIRFLGYSFERIIYNRSA